MSLGELDAAMQSIAPDKNEIDADDLWYALRDVVVAWDERDPNIILPEEEDDFCMTKSEVAEALAKLRAKGEQG
jgi:hypothetical protein